jgi:hypothetical protein
MLLRENEIDVLARLSMADQLLLTRGVGEASDGNEE